MARTPRVRERKPGTKSWLSQSLLRYRFLIAMVFKTDRPSDLSVAVRREIAPAGPDAASEPARLSASLVRSNAKANVLGRGPHDGRDHLAIRGRLVRLTGAGQGIRGRRERFHVDLPGLHHRDEAGDVTPIVGATPRAGPMVFRAVGPL